MAQLFCFTSFGAGELIRSNGVQRIINRAPQELRQPPQIETIDIYAHAQASPGDSVLIKTPHLAIGTIDQLGVDGTIVVNFQGRQMRVNNQDFSYLVPEFNGLRSGDDVFLKDHATLSKITAIAMDGHLVVRDWQERIVRRKDYATLVPEYHGLMQGDPILWTRPVSSHYTPVAKAILEDGSVFIELPRTSGSLPSNKLIPLSDYHLLTENYHGLKSGDTVIVGNYPIQIAAVSEQGMIVGAYPNGNSRIFNKGEYTRTVSCQTATEKIGTLTRVTTAIDSETGGKMQTSILSISARALPWLRGLLEKR